jgi:hypothetical protein
MTIVEKSIKEALKCLGCVFETKTHEMLFEKTKWCNYWQLLECRLVLFVFDNIPSQDQQ